MTTPPSTPPAQIRRGPPSSPPRISPANAPWNPAVPIVHALDNWGPLPQPPPFPPPSPEYVIFPNPPPYPPPDVILQNDGQGNPPPPNTVLADPLPSDEIPPGPSFDNDEWLETIHDWLAATRDLEDLVPGWHLEMSWQAGPRRESLARQVFRDGTFDYPIDVDHDSDYDPNDDIEVDDNSDDECNEDTDVIDLTND